MSAKGIETNQSRPKSLNTPLALFVQLGRIVLGFAGLSGLSFVNSVNQNWLNLLEDSQTSASQTIPDQAGQTPSEMSCLRLPVHCVTTHTVLLLLTA